MFTFSNADEHLKHHHCKKIPISCYKPTTDYYSTNYNDHQYVSSVASPHWPFWSNLQVHFQCQSDPDDHEHTDTKRHVHWTMTHHIVLPQTPILTQKRVHPAIRALQPSSITTKPTYYQPMTITQETCTIATTHLQTRIPDNTLRQVTWNTKDIFHGYFLDSGASLTVVGEKTSHTNKPMKT